MALYLNVLSAVLLAMVAGLLMALWVQLREWRRSAKAAPLLAEQLAEQMIAARRGLEDLKKTLVANGPELDRLISGAGKLRVELQFLIQRAEQVAGKLDAVPAPASVRPVAALPYANGAQVIEEKHVPSARAMEQVAGANGQAIQPAKLVRDPLEDLLAGLHQAEELADNAEIFRRPVKKRAGPVTQAELDLQQKIG